MAQFVGLVSQVHAKNGIFITADNLGRCPPPIEGYTSAMILTGIKAVDEKYFDAVVNVDFGEQIDFFVAYQRRVVILRNKDPVTDPKGNVGFVPLGMRTDHAKIKTRAG